ncbi:EAL domain-containing protein [Rubellimicrobium sp. CFH 75288]|uniref:EAL domain-containing protein n=1 Tax=Rubellimicrobium sp. CFH 75288 TaxID=2697034 RepID=UPI00141319AC|nr:EAL domain-containing protein [Rubellimicrobium sp. CFH 75288]NAZ38111.1 EAL domain-containing protein [Rubellimicrobium sp. CFH 75288]
MQVGVDPGRGAAASGGDGPQSPLEWAARLHEADLPAMIREALARDRAQLAFQPVVTAGRPPRVAFYEGFIRLLDERGTPLPAGAFFEKVEESGLGRELDCAALRLGLQMLRRQPRLRLAINMSARSIGDGTWRRILEAGLAEVGDRLILEISEGSAMLLPELVGRFMAEVQPRGVSFALDDFGAGLIAFRHLRDFLFDCVKVDRLFVSGIDRSPDNQVLVEALVTVARQFGMFAVAEGVETEAEAAHLRSLGVDCLQGYLFGRPALRL